MGKDCMNDMNYAQTNRQNGCGSWNTVESELETESCRCGEKPAVPCARRHPQPQPAADGTHIYFDACDGKQAVCVSTTCAETQCMGRILDVTATLQNVCPGRRSAVGLALTEVDASGSECSRGFRAVTVPAHNGSCSRDIQLETVRFILPEDQSLQRRRHFICRLTHHYMDDDFLWD